MAVKIYKPTTPGQRGMTGSSFEEITKTKPERSLLVSKSKKAGRNVGLSITPAGRSVKTICGRCLKVLCLIGKAAVLGSGQERALSR